MKLKHPFVVLKLRTGETLFGEFIDQQDFAYRIRNPLIIKTFPVSNGKDGLYLDKWIPFTEEEIFDIPDDLCYTISNLSDNYIKFYGAFLLRQEITKVNMQGNSRIREGEYGFSVYKDVVQTIKELGEDYAIKYGINPTQELMTEDDLSEDRTLN